MPALLGYTGCQGHSTCPRKKQVRVHSPPLNIDAAIALQPPGPAHWTLLQRARAVDSQAYVVAVSPARTTSKDPKEYVAWGHSSVVSPWGDVMVEATGDSQGQCINEATLKTAFMQWFKGWAPETDCVGSTVGTQSKAVHLLTALPQCGIVHAHKDPQWRV